MTPAHPPRPGRHQLIAHRRSRSLQIGPSMRLQFEDALTVHHQVAEVLRAERVTEPAAIREETDRYAHLVPDGTQWKATLMIELPDALQRSRELPVLSKAAHLIYVECESGRRVYAQANEDLPDRHLARPSGVHFLSFQLPAPMRRRLRQHDGACCLGCSHAHYSWRRVIPPAILSLLRGDLAPMGELEC